MVSINRYVPLSFLVKWSPKSSPPENDTLVTDSDYHACGSPSHASPVRAAEIMRQRTLCGLAVIVFY